MIQACSGGSEGMLPLENFEEMRFFTEKWSGQRLALLLTELDGGACLALHASLNQQCHGVGTVSDHLTHTVTTGYW